jgi:hypothetical protein
MSYTKEKWKLSLNHNWKTHPFSIIVQGKYGVHSTTIANIPTRMTIPPQEQKANAYLIAAAPAMYQALQKIAEMTCDGGAVNQTALAALAKAQSSE